MKTMLCGRKKCCPSVDIGSEYVVLENDGEFEGEIFHLTREQARLLAKEILEQVL